MNYNNNVYINIINNPTKTNLKNTINNIETGSCVKQVYAHKNIGIIQSTNDVYNNRLDIVKLDDICCICMHDMKQGGDKNIICLNKCNHIMHLSCFNMLYTNKCPICRCDFV